MKFEAALVSLAEKALGPRYVSSQALVLAPFPPYL